MWWIFFTLLEFLCCAAAFVLKVVTDVQSQQIFKANQKNSSEWGLFNSLSSSLTDLGIVTFYTLIIGVLLISRIVTKERKHGVFEKLLLTFGAVLFLIEGFLAFTSAEYMYTNIQVNSFVRGGLSLLNACLFLIDVCCSAQTQHEKGIQTDFPASPAQLPTHSSSITHIPWAVTPSTKCTIKELHPNVCGVKKAIQDRVGTTRMYLSTQL